jgi:hypothetical protein
MHKAMDGEAVEKLEDDESIDGVDMDGIKWVNEMAAYEGEGASLFIIIIQQQ